MKLCGVDNLCGGHQPKGNLLAACRVENTILSSETICITLIYYAMFPFHDMHTA